MKIAFLTSSRADYGIYHPLLKAMAGDPYFDVRIIAFGTHLSSFHGHTIDAIEKDGFRIDHTVSHILASDTAEAIATSMGLAFLKFTAIWEKENYDLVFCLGDRYEMFAAVSAASPFRIRFAHLHGGETTLGAIDNEFRHCLTIFSTMHFTATEAYAKRVADIKGSPDQVYAVGSLSLDNLRTIELLDLSVFRERFSIDLSKPSILVTFHPETVNAEQNRTNAEAFVSALEKFPDYQIIITMPNADTMGNQMREVYIKYADTHPNVKLVESFGTIGYFTCMKHAALVAGNSSSGIIEAASFGKFVINIGDRQKGRDASPNVLHCAADKESIESAMTKALAMGSYQGKNIYFRENVAQQIIEVLKKWVP